MEQEPPRHTEPKLVPGGCPVDRESRESDRGSTLIPSPLVGRIVRDDIDLLSNCSRFIVRHQIIEVEAEHRSLSGRSAYGFHSHEACDPETCELPNPFSPKHGSAPSRLLLGCVSPAVASHSEVVILTFIEVHAVSVIADHERGGRIGDRVWEFDLYRCRVCVPCVRHQLGDRVDRALVHLNPQMLDHTTMKIEVEPPVGGGHSFLGSRVLGHVAVVLWFTQLRFGICPRSWRPRWASRTHLNGYRSDPRIASLSSLGEDHPIGVLFGCQNTTCVVPPYTPSRDCQLGEREPSERPWTIHGRQCGCQGFTFVLGKSPGACAGG